MAMTLKQEEAIPASYPSADGDAIWQRVEGHVSFRWTPRQVIWTVSGDGEWKPPLAPANITLVEYWVEDTGWTAMAAVPGPFGIVFPRAETWRVTATVGDNATCPASVLEAVTRLAEYSAEMGKGMTSGSNLTSVSLDLDGLSLSKRFQKNWTGNALQLSGAADLLRRFRRA